jgi:hypothetical protein
VAINLRNPEAEAAVRELAARWNTTYTDTIRRAALQALAASPSQPDRARAAQAARIAAEWRAHGGCDGATRSVDLYDENGLWA